MDTKVIQTAVQTSTPLRVSHLCSYQTAESLSQIRICDLYGTFQIECTGLV